MGPPQLIRRHFLLAPLAAAFPSLASAQTTPDDAAVAWGRASALTWGEILKIPINSMTEGGGSMPAYSVARTEGERVEARARARAARQWGETEIARCRAMVSALGPAPQVGAGWEQQIIDRIIPEQITALDRLAVMFPFIETTGMRYVTGELEFTPVMRMCNYALFAETNWIMAATMRIGRLAFDPDSFADLWTRMGSLDFLVSSTACSTYMRVLNDDDPIHLTAARTVLTATATEVRQITAQYAAPDLSRLGLIGEQRQRLAPVMPQIAAIAAEHAARLDQTAQIWATLTSEQVLAFDASDDRAPQFMDEAGPVIERAGVHL